MSEDMRAQWTPGGGGDGDDRSQWRRKDYDEDYIAPGRHRSEDDIPSQRPDDVDKMERRRDDDLKDQD